MKNEVILDRIDKIIKYILFDFKLLKDKIDY